MMVRIMVRVIVRITIIMALTMILRVARMNGILMARIRKIMMVPVVIKMIV
jgi:hypothetical protein